jgi:hypothetical protein
MNYPVVRRQALEQLEPFVGEWQVEVGVPKAPVGRTVFRWGLDKQFLIQESEVPDPSAPNSLAIVAVGLDGTYTQHYFDARGVVRLYAMTVSNGSWTLVCDQPDFTPLDFSQRFVGAFAGGTDRIEGAWEMSAQGDAWRHDFDMSYTRVWLPPPSPA